MTAISSRRTAPVIAIDGPAGAGKSTLAAYLARRFGLLNLETGAMYRAFALKAMESGIPFDDAVSLEGLTATTEIAMEPHADKANRVLLDGGDVTARIREKDITEAASRVSVHPGVRSWMVKQQRALGERGGVVMEGRDIGTHVFPDAELKIFLDASDTVRGQRRFLQSDGADAERTEEDILATVRERDARDRNRVASPLVPAADAVHIDTSAMTLEEVCRRAEELVLAKLDR